MTERTNRGAHGRFIRSVKAAQRDFEAASLKAKGKSLAAIAAELGYASRGHVHDAISRAFAAIPAEGAEAAKALDLDRVDRLIEAAWKVLDTTHVTVSQGKIVGRFAGFATDPDTGETARDHDDKPIPVYEELSDDAPVLSAIDRIEKLLARRGRIIGYEAPSRSRVEVITEEDVDAELAAVLAANAAMEAEQQREASRAGEGAD